MSKYFKPFSPKKYANTKVNKLIIILKMVSSFLLPLNISALIKKLKILWSPPIKGFLIKIIFHSLKAFWVFLTPLSFRVLKNLIKEIKMLIKNKRDMIY